MTRIVTLNTGTKYQGYDYVGKLFRGLARNTTKRFQFECTTESDYPGWWGKINFFAPATRTIFLDLDTVITGNVDFLFDYSGPFCAWKDPWAEGGNSSVMSIAPKYGKNLRLAFEENAAIVMSRYHGDQNYLNAMIEKPDFWPTEKIKSYKADDLESGPKGASICVMHGQPKPHELLHVEWIRNNWL